MVYTLPQLWRGIQRGISAPAYFGRELNRLYHRRLYRYSYNPNGVAVMDEDWDTLIILDACRYDLFAEQHDFPGILEQRESRGSHTVEFLIGNFRGKKMLDTVYVTASPQLHRRSDRINAIFHDVVNVWQLDWDESRGTVIPDVMTDYGRQAVIRYPHKRLIIHYMQPHYPFIETPDIDVGQRLRSTNGGKDIWGRLMVGASTASTADIWDAYRENFHRVREAVHELLALLPGKTVVTADHGNMIGNRSAPIPIREWGHPPGTYTTELVRVPWHVIPGTNRRVIRAEPPVSHSWNDQPEPYPRPQSTENVARDRLRDLGYRD